MSYSAMQNDKHHTTNNALFSAAVIDENGKEIPITEAMIQQACEMIEKQWRFPANRTKVRLAAV